MTHLYSDNLSNQSHIRIQIGHYNTAWIAVLIAQLAEMNISEKNQANLGGSTQPRIKTRYHSLQLT